MQSPSSSSHHSSAQSGMYLTCTAILLVALVSVVGLGIDTGLVFRKQRYLQNAIDMAAFAGGMELNRGGSAADVEQHARELVLENARLMGFSARSMQELQASLDVHVLAGDSEIQISGRTLQDHLILGALPGFPAYTPVSAESRAVVSPISLILLLDISGSMDLCMTSPAHHPHCPPGDIGRLEAAKVAANYLLDNLRVKDQIGLVTFTTVIDASRGLSAELTQQNYASIIPPLRSALNALRPRDLTNLWDGLEAATGSMHQNLSPQPSTRQKVILALTDGAPFNDTLLPATRRTPCEMSAGAWQGLSIRAVNNAIEAQRLGYKIHTIGIGEEDTNTTNQYQQMGNADLVKSILLTELANDQELMRNRPPTPYAWDFPCMVRQSTPITGWDRRTDPQGTYAFAQDALRLQQLFEDVIRLYRVRLT